MSTTGMLLALFFVLAPLLVFADDEKPAKREEVKDVRESINKTAKNLEEEVKRIWTSVEKSANKAWKKTDKDKKKKTED